MFIGSILSFFKEPDKQLHALASFGFTLAVFVLLLPVNMYFAAVAAPIVCAAVVVLKARYDKLHPETRIFETLELAADGLGLLVALALVIFCVVCSR